MELRHLEYAVVLADELHFGRAAARLHIVQSGLSQQLKKLEREVGVALFSRSTHHVALTPAGEAFVVEARRTLESVAALGRLARAAGSETRELSVGISDAGVTDLNSLVLALRRQLPGVVVREVDGGTPDLNAQLLAGTLDLAVGTAMGVDGIAHEPLRIDRFGVCLAHGHPLADREEVSVVEVADLAVVLPPREMSADYLDLLDGIYARSGTQLRRHPDQRLSPWTALQVVARGDGVVVLPRIVALPPDIRWVPFSDGHAVQPWSLLWRSGAVVPLVATALDVARDHAAEQGWVANPALADHSQ